MASSLSNHVNNLADGIHRIECKYGHDNKKCETCRIKYKDCECFLGYKSFNDNLIKHKCLFCNVNFQVKFDENLKKILFIIYKFSNHDNSRCLSL